MNARERFRSIAREECIDAVYSREVVESRSRRDEQVSPLRQPARRRAEHLERGRSPVAPSPVREVALFI